MPHPEAGSPDTVGTWLTAAEVAATTDFKRTARQRGYLQAAYQVRPGLRSPTCSVNMLSFVVRSGCQHLLAGTDNTACICFC